jgi:enamine deaminase RidA (YjgF/YER057c/UK114 family)
MMKRKAINPQGMYKTAHLGFSHAVEQTSARTLHLAGQVAWNNAGELVGPGDLRVQARQALANLKAVLAEAGAMPADIVRLRVVDHPPDKLQPVTEEILAFYGGVDPAPNTWIGVQALALPEFLIEIEATAAL